MAQIAFIDPGLRDCGISIFSHEEGGELIAAHFVSAPRHPRNQHPLTAKAVCAQLLYYPLDKIVIERMEVRANRKDAWDDIIDLSIVTGCIIERSGLGDVGLLRPSKWTKGREKPISWRQGRARLDTDELRILDDAVQGLSTGDAAEVLDAVCMGLYYLHRL